MHAPATLSERGFSMVELLVAMLIGLIGMVIIFQVFEVSEGIKRTTVGGGDAQQNGVIALYTMERDFRNAGMGFNDTTFTGCDLVGFDSSRTTKDFPVAGQTMKLAPVSITSGAASTTPDRVSILYGSQIQAVGSVPLAADMDGTQNGADPLSLTNPFGYSNGDVLVLVEPGTTKKCSIMEVTGIAGNIVSHAFNASYPIPGDTGTARFNKSGGLGVVYKGNGTANVSRVFNLGNLYYKSPGANAPVNLPVYNTYALANGSLTVTSQFQISAGQPLSTSIADNIVHMRALYGLDDGVNDLTVPYDIALPKPGDGIVDRYVDAATFDALVAAAALNPAVSPWPRLIAVRIAVVSRSAQPDKPSTGNNSDACDATTTEPQWTGTPWAGGGLNYKTRLDVSASVAAPDDWKCYRYRVFETTIPLRNWIWKSS